MSQDTNPPLGRMLSDELPPEMSVLMGVFLLYLKVSEVMDTITIQPDLPKSERHVLICLAEPRRMGELAAELQVQPSTVTAIADSLDRKGLVTRERDPQDRRAFVLTLTKEGTAARGNLIATAARIFNEVSGITPAETSQLSQIMKKVANNIAANGLPKGMDTCQ